MLLQQCNSCGGDPVDFEILVSEWLSGRCLCNNMCHKNMDLKQNKQNPKQT
jgi:hypothetical protein